MAKEETYFIKIANQNQTRRLLLENTREIIRTLRVVEQFKDSRNEKIKLMTQFEGQLDEIRSLINNVKRMFPKSTIKFAKKQIPEKALEGPHELKKLEQELMDIEAKLGEL